MSRYESGLLPTSPERLDGQEPEGDELGVHVAGLHQEQGEEQQDCTFSSNTQSPAINLRTFPNNTSASVLSTTSAGIVALDHGRANIPPVPVLTTNPYLGASPLLFDPLEVLSLSRPQIGWRPPPPSWFLRSQHPQQVASIIGSRSSLTSIAQSYRNQEMTSGNGVPIVLTSNNTPLLSSTISPVNRPSLPSYSLAASQQTTSNDGDSILLGLVAMGAQNPLLLLQRKPEDNNSDVWGEYKCKNNSIASSIGSTANRKASRTWDIEPTGATDDQH